MTIRYRVHCPSVEVNIDLTIDAQEILWHPSSMSQPGWVRQAGSLTIEEGRPASVSKDAAVRPKKGTWSPGKLCASSPIGRGHAGSGGEAGARVLALEASPPTSCARTTS